MFTSWSEQKLQSTSLQNITLTNLVVVYLWPPERKPPPGEGPACIF